MSSQHTRIPYGMIRQLCYSGGVRLPRLVDGRPKEEPLADVVEISLRPVRQELIHVVGNLPNHSYRYFKGSSAAGSKWFQCRGCAEHVDGLHKIVPHLAECRPLIHAIIEVINRDKVCALCNAGTTRRGWGIPLCSVMCEDKWRFQVPEPWWVARRFVIARNPTLLRKSI